MMIGGILYKHSDGELPYGGIQWAHLIWCSCHEVDQDGDDNALTYGDQDGDDDALTYDDDDCDLPVTPCTLLAEHVLCSLTSSHPVLMPSHFDINDV